MNTFQRKLNQKFYIFIQENAFENVVCEITAILSRGNELTHVTNAQEDGAHQSS